MNLAMSDAAHQAYSIAIVGSGGAGVMTLGAVLLEVAAHTGYFGSFSKLFGPQVRGGEAAAHAFTSLRDFYAHALAIEREAAHRYQDLAQQMETHNNLAVAETFERLARMEADHADHIARAAPDAVAVSDEGSCRAPHTGSAQRYSGSHHEKTSSRRLDSHGGAPIYEWQRMRSHAPPVGPNWFVFS